MGSCDIPSLKGYFGSSLLLFLALSDGRKRPDQQGANMSHSILKK